MTIKKDERFTGFTAKTLNFLKNLRANNNKAWFEAHRQDYEQHLLKPLQNLVLDMGAFMLTIDPHFEITPAVNKTISRIYRDTRFSRDKSPYRGRMWIAFKRRSKDLSDAPSYFFEISIDSYRYGMGFYSASTDTMRKFRKAIDIKPGEFRKAISFYPKQRVFVLEGEKYKRVLDENKPEEIQEWYQRRNLYLVCNRPIDNRLFSGKLVDDLISGFGLLKHFFHYLWKIKLQRLEND